MITLSALLVFALLLAIDPVVVQGSAVAIAGALSVPIAQIIKRASGISGGAMLVVAAAIAVALTVIAILLTGQPFSPKGLIADAAIVFSISQVIFKMLVADKTPDNAVKGSNSLR